MKSFLRRGLKTAVFATLVIAPTLSYGFDKEVLSLSSRTKWGFLQGKQFIINIVSDSKGPIGSILSNPQRSSLNLKFEKASPHRLTREESSIASQKFGIIPRTLEVFDGVGFPMVGQITRWHGSYYALLMLTKNEPDPALLFSFIDNPASLEASKKAWTERKGVSGSVGDAFGGGVHFWFPIDGAALVNLDEERPKILKVYEVKKPAEGLEDYDINVKLQEVISHYAFMELKTHYSPLTTLENCRDDLDFK